MNLPNILKKGYQIVLANLKLAIFLGAVLGGLCVMFMIYDQFSHPREDYNEYDYPRIADNLKECHEKFANEEDVTEMLAAENYRNWRTCILTAQSLEIP